ncbi:hypothetical protein D3C81_2193840 [compost metagenome]
MQHIQVLLLVDILQLGMPQAHLGGLVIELVFTPGEVEAIRGRAGPPGHEHALHAGVVARAVAAKLPGVEGQVGNFP